MVGPGWTPRPPPWPPCIRCIRHTDSETANCKQWQPQYFRNRHTRHKALFLPLTSYCSRASQSSHGGSATPNRPAASFGGTRRQHWGIEFFDLTLQQ
jgi:hypothetical protein